MDRDPQRRNQRANHAQIRSGQRCFPEIAGPAPSRKARVLRSKGFPVARKLKSLKAACSTNTSNPIYSSLTIWDSKSCRKKRRDPSGNHHAPLREPFHHDDLQSTHRRMGQIAQRCPCRQRDPRPLASSCRNHPHQRSQLPTAAHGQTWRSLRALRTLQFKPKAGINGTSLRASLHLFRFDLELEDAPRKGGHWFLPLIAARSCLAPID
jgi:hypothetical protein